MQKMSVPGPQKFRRCLSQGLNRIMSSIGSVSLFNGIVPFMQGQVRVLRLYLLSRVLLVPVVRYGTTELTDSFKFVHVG